MYIRIINIHNMYISICVMYEFDIHTYNLCELCIHNLSCIKKCIDKYVYDNHTL